MRNKEGKKKKKREWRIERAAVTMNVKSPEAKSSLFLVLLRFVAQNGKKKGEFRGGTDDDARNSA